MTTDNIQSSPTDTEAPGISAILAEEWSRATNPEEPAALTGFFLESLAKVTGEDGRSGAEDWRVGALAEIQELAGSERAFIFEVTTTLPEEPDDEREVEAGRCLQSLDFDHEPVPKPESKVPMTLLRRSLRNGRPIWAADTLEDGADASVPEDLLSRVRGFIVVPMMVRETCHGILYLEHRFQPLQIARQDASKLVFLLRCLGLRQAFEALSAENRSLWSDLFHLRERWKAAESLSRESARGKSSARSPRRSRTYKGDYDFIVGSSPAMHDIFQLLDRIRSSSAPVLINGDSGTGKELIATAVHMNSPRKEGNFVSENCGALTETLLESELFGYVKGAFTGAHRDHKGLFELASGGTLFLDEVGDMSPAMQKKLLRSIQEGVIRRVGGKEYVHVDVRIISATNKDLLTEVRRGNFREDLYYRLNVINIKLPPLRERREDIPELVQHFLAKLEKESGTEKEVSPQALQLMIKHSWPGNIRELQNEVNRLFALSDGRIEVSHLSEAIRRGEARDLLSSNLEEELRCLTLREAMEKVERALIRRALLESQGNKSQVAKLLQIPKTSLYNKIAKYQLDQEVQSELF